MASLLDITPSKETVKIRGKNISVTGISVAGLARLVGEFYHIRSMLEGGEGITAKELLAAGPDIVAAILAAGTGDADSEKARENAKHLSADEQLQLLVRILEVTFPRGPENFIQEVTRIAESVNMPDSSSEPGKQ